MNHKFGRALDVACERGLLTKDLLKGLYAKVDLFDANREMIKTLAKEFAGDKTVT